MTSRSSRICRATPREEVRDDAAYGRCGGMLPKERGGPSLLVSGWGWRVRGAGQYEGAGRDSARGGLDSACGVIRGAAEAGASQAEPQRRVSAQAPPNASLQRSDVGMGALQTPTLYRPHLYLSTLQMDPRAIPLRPTSPTLHD